jgi:MFS family permease
MEVYRDLGRGKLAVLIFLGILWGILTYGLDWLFKEPTVVGFYFADPLTQYTDMGILLGVMAAVNAVAMLPSGRIADRLGRKPIVIISFLGLAGSYFGYTFTVNFAPVLLLYVFGIVRMIFAATAWVALLAWVADHSSEKNRGTIMSALNAALTVANIGALAVVGALYQYTNLYMTFLVVALIQLIATVPLLFVSKGAGEETGSIGKTGKAGKGEKLRTWREVIHDRPLMILGISALFATSPGLLIQFIMLPLFASPEYGFTMVETTIPLAVMMLFTMVGYGVAAYAVDKMKIKRTILIISMIASIIPLALLFLTAYLPFMQNIVSLVISFGIFGLALGITMPTYLAIMTDLAPTGETGTELGVFQGILNFNYVIGNFFGGYLWSIGKLPTSMLGCIVLVLVALVLVVGTLRKSVFEGRKAK